MATATQTKKRHHSTRDPAVRNRAEANKRLAVKGKLLKRQDDQAIKTEEKKRLTMETGREKLIGIDEQIEVHEAESKSFFKQNQVDLVRRKNQKSIRLPSGRMGFKKKPDKLARITDKKLVAERLSTLHTVIDDLTKKELSEFFHTERVTKFHINTAKLKSLLKHPDAPLIFDHLGIEVIKGKNEFFMFPTKGDEIKEFARDPKGAK